jgi:hypothetical protein
MDRVCRVKIAAHAEVNQLPSYPIQFGSGECNVGLPFSTQRHMSKVIRKVAWA